VASDSTHSPPRKKQRYLSISEEIQGDIDAGRYQPGERLPSDSELGARFGVSRLTVIRALRALEHHGSVQRKAGSGTYVRDGGTVSRSLVFGLLMPDVGDGEVFEPISRGIVRAGETLHHRLLWGNAPDSWSDKERQAEELSRYFIASKVNGVFFAPVELTQNQEAVNRRIAASLSEAGIPIVLVDRCYLPYPDRSPHDLVGIDNRRAGFRMTRHLLAAGCRRVGFAFRPGSAATVDARKAGYREALASAGLEAVEIATCGNDLDELQKFLSAGRPDGMVCANDLTAARLMHDLLRLGCKVPEDIKMVGINDVKYASFLPVPLTTLHQPCTQLGVAAMSMMLERLQSPAAPVRDVLLDCEMVERQSCGANRETRLAARQD
jgi:GntR family transcriptional regulator, arabinose operon transcriptional repressor